MTDIYHIRIKGHLDPAWTSDFGGMTLHHLDNGVTLLSGPVVDQAALHGILARIRDLGVPLLSVQQVNAQERTNESPYAGRATG